MSDETVKQAFVFVDRYSATGRPRPDPKTACKRCEAMGFYPARIGGSRAYRFKKCSVCRGTGKRPTGP